MNTRYFDYTNTGEKVVVSYESHGQEGRKAFVIEPLDKSISQLTGYNQKKQTNVPIFSDRFKVTCTDGSMTMDCKRMAGAYVMARDGDYTVYYDENVILKIENCAQKLTLDTLTLSKFPPKFD
jgi:hypothetical protein